MPCRFAVVIGAVAALGAGCSNASERAWGAPHTDISDLSTETGYAERSPYAVLDARRQGGTLTLDVNVLDLGRAAEIGRRAILEQKGDATRVVENVYDSMSKPPKPAWMRIEWTKEGGFKVTASRSS